VKIVVHGVKFSGDQDFTRIAADTVPCHSLPTKKIAELQDEYSKHFNREVVAIDVTVLSDDALDQIGEWANNNLENDWVQTVAKIKTRQLLN